MENTTSKNLTSSLLELVHEYGYMSVESELKNSVLNRASSSDPFVFMTKLLRTETLDCVVDNNFSRNTNAHSSVVDSGVINDEVFKIIKIDEFYYKITGYADSYSDTTWTGWSVVTPKQKTITIYE